MAKLTEPGFGGQFCIDCLVEVLLGRAGVRLILSGDHHTAPHAIVALFAFTRLVPRVYLDWSLQTVVGMHDLLQIILCRVPHTLVVGHAS